MSGTLSYAGEQSTPQFFVAPYLVRLWVADKLHLPSSRLSIAEVDEVRIGRGAELSSQRTHDGSAALVLTVPDGWMSSRHASLKNEKGAWTLHDEGSKNGSFVNARRVESRPLLDGDVFMTGNTCFLFRSSVQRSHLEPADLDSTTQARLPLVQQTLSLPLTRIFADLTRVARSEISIVLTGETGTGKELSARFIHETSGRNGRFVAVNCGAIPANLIESELFGHRKGAFSGATTDRVGLVQASDGGTLFLDEIAELSAEAQVKLLRVLQEREVQPVGATKPIPVALRVVAATHEDLAQRCQDGLFRADLLARLSGVQVALPALRHRKEDLGILLRSILSDAQNSKILDREAATALALYDWPSNIREFEQALTAAIAWGETNISLAQLPPAIGSALEASKSESSEDENLRAQLSHELHRHQGNVSAVAREMGKARVQIRRWCKRFGFDPADFRS